MVRARIYRRRRRVALLTFVGLLAVVVIALWRPWQSSANQQQTQDPSGPAVTQSAPPSSDAPPTSSPDPTPEPPPYGGEARPGLEYVPPQPFVFTVVAAGDVLTHGPVNDSAKNAGGGTYDYSPLMANLDPWVQGADLAICHMEVPISPDGQTPTGYPVFGAPPQIATDLKEAGWDGCSTASNHSVDRRTAGVYATLDYFDAAGLGHVGTARTEAEAAQAQWYELTKGERTVRVATFAATFGTNGIPQDETWRVQWINTEQLINQATQARADGADIVIVSVHGWIEYQTAPTKEQVAIAEALAASGQVDLLIGHHAHVPQPFALLPGGPGGEGMWVAYGLGNYLSNQSRECCVAATEAGLMMVATFTLPDEGPVQVDMAWTAVTVDRTNRHTMYHLSGLVANGEGTPGFGPAAMQGRWERLVEAVAGTAPEVLEPPVPNVDSVVVVPRTP